MMSLKTNEPMNDMTMTLTGSEKSARISRRARVRNGLLILCVWRGEGSTHVLRKLYKKRPSQSVPNMRKT